MDLLNTLRAFFGGLIRPVLLRQLSHPKLLHQCEIWNLKQKEVNRYLYGTFYLAHTTLYYPDTKNTKVIKMGINTCSCI